MSELLHAFSAAGGFVGLGSLIAAVAAWRKSSSAAHELKPNHGSSVADRVDQLIEMQRSQGHQLGEIRDDMTVMRQHLDRVTEAQLKRR